MASSRDIIRVLERNGFVIQSQNGSHVKLMKSGRHTIVPHPRKDMRGDFFIHRQAIRVKETGL